MYLSKLEIIGFKSFATKTALGFDSGISAIVGPNGCGKTNIVDAIRWVLGEQRYSALRSEKMEDVIFNGTKSRKPLGMAEASLVIENTKGILPSEYSQVTIGRRVYRSAESEYLINKVPCRLKDIQDLFMDTGMGADAYSVIELKMVESILSDRTDERRHLFEEAAGVTKYKHRRKAAYRKLESVQADLVRVNDIVVEVHKAVSTLERQAKKAEQHHEVRNRLKEMEIDLMEREYAQLHARSIPLRERLLTLQNDKVIIDGTLSSQESRLEELRQSIGELERRFAEAQLDVNSHLEQLSRGEQKNLVVAERRKALDDAILRIENEQAILKEERDALDQRKIHLLNRIGECNREEQQSASDLEKGRAELVALETELAQKRGELQGLADRTIVLINDIAQRQGEQEKKRGRVENLQGRSMRAEEEIRGYEREILSLEDEITRMLEEDKRLRRKFTETEIRFYDAETKKNQLKEKIENLHNEEIQLRTEMERRLAKLEFLRGLIRSREGLSEGVRFLASTGELSERNILTVADAAIADEKYRAAIEAALGDVREMMIVNSPAEADRAMDRLKAEDRGKATFVCLERLPEMSDIPVVPRYPGVCGWASELVRCQAVHRGLFRFVLDRVLVVEHKAAAMNVLRNTVGLRCTTLDGEIASSVGIARGGSRREDEGGAIGKLAQIEEVQREIDRLQQLLSENRERQQGILKEHDAVDVKVFHDEVKSVEKEMSSVEVRMAQLEFEKKRARDIIAKDRGEIEELSAEASSLMDEVAVEVPSLDTMREARAEVERRVGGVQAELELLERQWNERSKMVNDLSVRVATLRGEAQNAQNDWKRTEERIGDINSRLERLENEILLARNEKTLSSRSLEENEDILSVMQNALREAENRKASVEAQLLQYRQETHQIELQIKDDRRRHDDSLEAIHELELRIADLSAKADHLKARALEEFEMHLELRSYPNDEFVDFAELRSEIQRLRERIKSLGNINFAAFEEYNTEKQRFEFLTAQRKDLVEAEKTLLSTIEEINTTAQRKFLETFGKIRTNFIETFKSLFDPGDECDLRLEEGVDPLEARIEITAKPRGKRPTSIDLLSGGEKTLTATALLFAIYLVKPSPFCILDEVDAPLDDANIDRFTRILRKFSDNTQFIVVTHNKRTMEAANALYGVTMEEEGVSKLVTVRFNQSGVRSAELISG